MQMLALIGLLASGALAEIRTPCAELCAKTVCPTPEPCGDGVWLENVTTCGCCGLCIRQLEEGDPCDAISVATVPQLECGAGLSCQPDVSRGGHSCQTARTRCAGDRARSLTEAGLTTGPPTPDCDTLGDYKPVQCKPGMMCYCAAKDGARIFGTAPYLQRHGMDCACSRERHEARLDVDEWLRCDSQGNYAALQCTESTCYCLKARDLKLDGRTATHPGSLKCYERRKTPCWDRRAKERPKKSTVLLGTELPACDPDGTFAPRQCNRTHCYCVNPEGRPYPNSVGLPRPEGDSLACYCERERDLRRASDNSHFARYTCDVAGDYCELQCVSQYVCFCVDSYGFQSDAPAVLYPEQHRLPCHPTHRSCRS